MTTLSQSILHFLPTGPAPLRVLVVETSRLLPDIHKKLPNAKITAVTEYDAVPETKELKSLDISWALLDYRTQPLPFEAETFDLVVAEPALTYALDPYELLLALGHVLTDVGTLVTAFRNIRYYGVLENLMRGEFPERERHLYAKAEVVRLLNDSLFKEITFAPGEQDAPASGAAFAAMGFDDTSHDLATAVWLVRATRSTAAVANLKSLYKKETRKQLARLLHRIEYGVKVEENLEALKQLCKEEGIFSEYLEDFIHEVVVHPERIPKGTY